MKKASTKNDLRIRKGPWSAEEDEVLINFVNKNGPKAWSSIQSKGLLHRNGKSCRLRWINKLQPNLKGCKFSAEEERVVVELQASFGNKWAMIALYLQGRTDNDVKNFWNYRKKRLARTFNSTSLPSSKNLYPKQKSAPVLSNFEAPSSMSNSMVEVAHVHPSSSSSNLVDHSSPRLSNIETASSLAEPITTQQGELGLISDSSSLWFSHEATSAPVSNSSWNPFLSSSYTSTFPLILNHQNKDFEQVFCEPTKCCTAANYHSPVQILSIIIICRFSESLKCWEAAAIATEATATT